MVEERRVGTRELVSVRHSTHIMAPVIFFFRGFRRWFPFKDYVSDFENICSCFQGEPEVLVSKQIRPDDRHDGVADVERRLEAPWDEFHFQIYAMVDFRADFAVKAFDLERRIEFLKR